MALEIVRRREVRADAHAQELDPRPGAEQLIDELARLEALKDAGILSMSQYTRRRAHIFHALV